MNSTATTNWGYQATAGAAARRDRWSETPTAFGLSTHAAVIKPMPSAVVKNAKGIRHRPPEDSN